MAVGAHWRWRFDYRSKLSAILHHNQHGRAPRVLPCLLSMASITQLIQASQ